MMDHTTPATIAVPASTAEEPPTSTHPDDAAQRPHINLKIFTIIPCDFDLWSEKLPKPGSSTEWTPEQSLALQDLFFIINCVKRAMVHNDRMLRILYIALRRETPESIAQSEELTTYKRYRTLLISFKRNALRWLLLRTYIRDGIHGKRKRPMSYEFNNAITRIVDRPRAPI